MRSNCFRLYGSFRVIVFTLPLMWSCGQPIEHHSNLKERWNSLNNPIRFSSAYNFIWPDLPKEGKLDFTPWPDSYWPSYAGGIADRWNYHDDNSPNSDSGSDAFKYDLYTLEQLKKMSLEDLKKLSPAEKYDIFVGDYDYPTVKRERRRTDPDRPSWEGLCHGWAAAALNFKEPGAITLEGANGINVPFGASDVKGLLTYYQGEISESPFHMLGARCEVASDAKPEDINSIECRDTNAGAFHVVIANQIGLLKEGFVADLSRYQEVWNYPIYSFKTKEIKTLPPSEGAAPGTVKEVEVMTEMTYVTESGQSWEKAEITADYNSFITDDLNYRLEIDEEDNVLGGEWLDERRPDFLWTHDVPEFEGYFRQLKDIYEAATH